MNQNRASFLQALAQCTRLNYAPGASDSEASPLWIVLVRSLMGLAYGILGGFLLWVLRSAALAAFLGTVAVAILHLYLTNSRTAAAPGKIRRAFLPGDNPTADLLANLAIPAMLFLLLFNGGAAWLPSVMALSTTIAAELSSPLGKGANLHVGKCWGLALLVVLGTIVIPHVANRPALQVEFLRGVILAGISFLLTPWLKNCRVREKGFDVNCAFAGAIVLFLALLAIAF